MSGLNRIMLDNALGVMKAAGAASLMIFIDASDDWGFWKKSSHRKKLIIVTQSPESEKELEACRKEFKAVLRLPAIRLTRVGRIKLSIIMCMTEGIIGASEKVVCLAGMPGTDSLDTMMVIDMGKESEVFSTIGISKDLFKKVKPEVLETVLNLALELSNEGREGKPIGTIFVVGDHEKVLDLSRPLIMNPFKGYPEESRNLLDYAVHETMKEFALLDGAFVISEAGVVMSAGVHLDAALKEEGLMPGLGCRHMAAAGITDVTEAAAITISGSTGIVRIFRKGKILIEIEKAARGRAPGGDG